MRNKTLFMTGLFVLMLMASCHQGEELVQTTLYLKGYERFQPDTSKPYIDLRVSKVYPADLTCIGYTKYANLYITKVRNGDSLYVFEYCRKVSEMVYDTTDRYPPEILIRDIPKDRQDSVIIWVPPNFKLPTGVKYVFADVGYLVES